VDHSGGITTQIKQINVGGKMMKKMFLSLILTFLITVPVLSLGTDTTIRSMMTLASGKTLLTLRATYDGLWPTSPPLAFFVTTLSDGVLITEYITWAGADRYADFSIVLPPGTYYAQSATYQAVGGLIQVAPDGLPYGPLTITVEAPDNPGIPTLNVPAPLFTVATEGSDILLNMSYSMDNLVGTGAVSYTFEIQDTFGTEMTRYYSSESQFIISNSETGDHVLQVRVVADLGDAVGFSPLSTVKVVTVFPKTRLIVPWYANIPELGWGTLLSVSSKENDVPITMDVISYKYQTIGSKDILIKNTTTLQEESNMAPWVFNVSDFVDYESGYLEIVVNGVEASGLTLFTRTGDVLTYDGTPMMDSRKASNYHFIPMQMSGPVGEFNPFHSYSVVNNTDSPITFYMVYHISSDGCGRILGNTVMTAPVIVRPHDVWALGYDYNYLRTLLGIIPSCVGPLYFSTEIYATGPVLVQAAIYDLDGGFGIWNN